MVFPCPKLPDLEYVRLYRDGVNSSIHLCLNKTIGRLVAVKCSPFGVSDTRREELLREARLLESLSHPNVVRAFRHGVTENLVFMELEYVRGVTLDEYVKRYDFPDAVMTAHILDQLLSALIYLHSHNPPVTHMDLSPSNVMMDLVQHRIVLIDFGSAAAQSAIKPFTPGFASLERCAGAPPHPSMDVFAAGAILAFLVGGRPAILQWAGPVIARMQREDPARRPDAMECARLLRGSVKHFYKPVSISGARH